MVSSASSWSSLEIAKLVVASAVPIIVVGFGFYISRGLGRLEEAQWANRQVVERRLKLYDEFAPKLNRLYCFFALVGDYQNTAPPTAITLKRDLDHLFYVNRFLFDDPFSKAYFGFINTCFRINTGYANPAKLRTGIDGQRKIVLPGIMSGIIFLATA
jgi:hypothetical protein